MQNGRVVYSKSNDHIIDSARSAFLARDRAMFNEGTPEVLTGLAMPMATDPVFW